MDEWKLCSLKLEFVHLLKNPPYKDLFCAETDPQRLDIFASYLIWLKILKVLNKAKFVECVKSTKKTVKEYFEEMQILDPVFYQTIIKAAISLLRHKPHLVISIITKFRANFAKIKKEQRY